MVAHAGTLIVIAAARNEDDRLVEGPPWQLIRAEIESFATGDLQAVRIEDVHDVEERTIGRWRAEFRRTAGMVGRGA